MLNANVVDGLNLDQMTDEELCRLSREGNSLAEGTLVIRYLRLVRSCARPYFLAGGDSDDLLQEGMLGLLKAIREYDGEKDASFLTFADTCILRRIYSALKEANSAKHSPLNESVPLNPSLFDANASFAQVDPEELMIEREKAAAMLEDVRKQLSDFEVKILGYYLEGLTCREISEAVNRPPKSVDNAIQRIRKKVAMQLGDISK